MIATRRDDARRVAQGTVLWLVYEMAPAYDRRDQSLVFDTDGLVRRVRNFPHNWRDLPDDELLLIRDRT